MERISDSLTRLILNTLLPNNTGKVLIVGVDGKGCSGKSHFAKSLQEELGENNVKSVLLSTDDFCNHREKRYQDNVAEGLQVYHNNFEEESITHILQSASTLKSFSYKGLHVDVLQDLKNKEIAFDLNAGDILIFEGLYLFKKRFRDFFHLRIILDISDESQIERALKRDVSRGIDKADIPLKYRRRFIPSYEFYMEEDKPFECADFIIDNNDPIKPYLKSRK